MWNFKQNQKAIALGGISSGLILWALTIKTVSYISIIAGILLLGFSIYEYIKNINKPLIHDKKLGFLYLIIGALFLLAMAFAIYEATLPIYSIFIGIISAIIPLGVGVILIKK